MIKIIAPGAKNNGAPLQVGETVQLLPSLEVSLIARGLAISMDSMVDLGPKTAAEISTINSAILAGIATYPAGSQITLAASGTTNGTIYRLKGVGTSASFSVDGGSSGLFGPYADITALQTAKPAASNPGAVAYVGPVTPYAIYDSNGLAWTLRAASSENSQIYEYAKGAIRPRSGIKPSRITVQPTVWYALSTPTSLSGNVTVATDATMLLSRASCITFTQTTAGFTQNDWTSLSLAMPANGLLMLPCYFGDFNGVAPSFTVVLSNAGGSITYSFSGAAIKLECWCQMPLWNPATAANAAFVNPGPCSVSANTGFNFASPCTSISIRISNMAVGMQYSFGAIETMAYTRPAVCFTNDVTDGSSFSFFKPALEAVGLRGGFRIGGFTDSSYTGSNIANLQTVYAAGHDVYNGTWSRTSLTASTTRDFLAKEILACHNRAVSYGFTRGMTWLSTAGNALADQRLNRIIGPLLGYKVFKSGGGSGLVNLVSSSGVDDPYNLLTAGLASGNGSATSWTVSGTIGQTTVTASGTPTSLRIGVTLVGTGFAANSIVTNLVGNVITISQPLTSTIAASAVSIASTAASFQVLFDALLYTGGLLVYFTHDFIAAAGTQTGTSCVSEDITTFLAYIKTKIDANLVDGYTPSQVDLLLQGEL